MKTTTLCKRRTQHVYKAQYHFRDRVKIRIISDIISNPILVF